MIRAVTCVFQNIEKTFQIDINLISKIKSWLINEFQEDILCLINLISLLKIHSQDYEMYNEQLKSFQDFIHKVHNINKFEELLDLKHPLYNTYFLYKEINIY